MARVTCAFINNMTKEQDLLDKIVEDVQTADAVVPQESAAPEEKPFASAPKAMTMDDLVTDDAVVAFPAVGDVLKGIVIDVSPSAIYLDLGPIGTGIVLGKETKDGLAMNTKMVIGDEATATLIDLENDEGYIELSIREASYEKAWEDLRNKMKNEDTVSTRILDANKGGLMVEVNGITGFLPVSQLSSQNYPRVDDGDRNKILELLKQLVNQELGVRILDADQDSEKLIVSEKAAQSEQERKVISELAKGEVINGEVSGVVDFGAFVKFQPPGREEGDQLEGLVHISELAWQLIDNPRELVKVGDAVEAKIIGIDDTRISLSMKALKRDPWSVITEKYTIGDVYEGTVDKINHFGAFVYLDSDIHGLAHVSEFQENFPGKKMEDMIAVGKQFNWKVLSIDAKEHRMGLVLVKDSVSAKKESSASAEKKTPEQVEEKKETKESNEAKETQEVKGSK